MGFSSFLGGSTSPYRFYLVEDHGAPFVVVAASVTRWGDKLAYGGIVAIPEAMVTSIEKWDDPPTTDPLADFALFAPQVPPTLAPRTADEISAGIALGREAWAAGDAGIAAHLLNVPLGDVQRVSGGGDG